MTASPCSSDGYRSAPTAELGRFGPVVYWARSGQKRTLETLRRSPHEVRHTAGRASGNQGVNVRKKSSSCASITSNGCAFASLSCSISHSSSSERKTMHFSSSSHFRRR